MGKNIKGKRIAAIMIIIAIIIGMVPIYPLASIEEADNEKPEVTLLFNNSDENKLYYTSNVDIEISAVDSDSGIDSIKYEVIKGQETLKSNTIMDNELISITLDKEKNSNVEYKLLIWAKDKSGNEAYIEETIIICDILPEITVSIDGSISGYAEEGYYNNKRTATITVKDTFFNESLAKKAIKVNGYEVDTLIWERDEENVYKTEIEFDNEDKYNWEVAGYVNEIGQEAVILTDEQSVSVYDFTIDKTAPTGMISIGGKEWFGMVSNVSFDFFKNIGESVLGTCIDKNKVNSIEYYKSDDENISSLEMLDEYYTNNKFTTEPYKIEEEGEFIVYARLADKAGNVTYISTSGLIVDNTESFIMLSDLNKNENGYNNSNPKVELKVIDKFENNNIFSGLNSVTYSVYIDGVMSEEGDIYKFNREPLKANLKKYIEREIEINSMGRDSENVLLNVIATDNSGNVRNESLILKISETKPTILVEYNNSSETKYFQDSREATVTIIDKSFVFDEESATDGIRVNIIDENKEIKELDIKDMISNWTSDGDRHTATIKFDEDGSYDWSVDYTNIAGNSIDTFQDDFIIDKTKPTGKVKIGENIWSSLLNKITFGLYANKTVTVKAEAYDNIGPCEIEYYKTDKEEQMTEEELQLVKFIKFEEFEVTSDEEFVVYLKIIDAAGNYSYINSDGYIVDKAKSNINLMVVNETKDNIYKEDINININVTDEEPFSGIKEVEYWIEKDGKEDKREKIYEFNNKNPSKSELIGEFNKDIIITSDNKNYAKVVLHVKVIDNAGNISQVEKEMRIFVRDPKVQVAIDGYIEDGAEDGYYNKQRTASITIIDDYFDEVAATNAIRINNSKIEGLHWISQGDVHKTNIEFNEDKEYEWEIIDYINKEGQRGIINNDLESSNIYKFVIDTTSPSGMITIGDKSWSNLPSGLNYSFFNGYSNKVLATCIDINKISDVVYYKASAASLYNIETLNQIYNEGNFINDSYELESEEEFVVYARLKDKAGNIKYIGTNGVIIDNTKSIIKLEDTTKNKNGYNNKDAIVSVKVKDNIQGIGTFSGINSVRYVVKSGDIVIKEEELYNVGIENLSKDQLRKEVNADITVDSKGLDSDNVKVIVYSEDNSGNESSESITLKINTTKPTVKVEYNNSSENKYFPYSRMATITITDKSIVFNEDIATNAIKINAIDADGEKIEVNNEDVISKWVSDGDKHIATVMFNDEGIYNWAIEYENIAGNATASFQDDFIIDKTKPTGEVEIGKNVWKSLLSKITFGLYSNKEVMITAKANDNIGPCIVEYYKTNNEYQMTEEELDLVSLEPFEELKVSSDEAFVVYFKITDSAGNYTYISSDGYIVDTVESNIKLTVLNKSENNIYNEDVKINVNVSDSKPYSGIKRVDYWIEKDNIKGNVENLYLFENEMPIKSELVGEFNEDIIIDSEKNNSSNVKLWIKAIDNAGNEKTEMIPLDIDITKPKINVEYDDNNNGGNVYYNTSLKATIEIIERTNHFSVEDFVDGVIINAVDEKGNKVEVDIKSMISEFNTVEGEKPDLASHTATIFFDKDANYEFDFNYVDKALNQSDEIVNNKFTIDKVKPKGIIMAKSKEGRSGNWNSLASTISFGFWSGKSIDINAEIEDETSGIKSTQYYISKEDIALKEEELQKITTWNDFDSLLIEPNSKVTVYLKITDRANNISYVSTDGLIVDNTSPRTEVMAPKISASIEEGSNEIYNGDVKIDVSIKEPLIDGVHSGLKNINYRVLNMGEETQKGNLYTFNGNEPMYNELLQEWKGQVIVNSTLNNSNDVVIEIYAEDNSLNSDKESISIKIDKTTPVINISYDNNSPQSERYYKDERRAQILVTERNFNPKDVKVNITNNDGVIPKISNWTTIKGTGNGDSTINVATIVYSGDGDYSFSIEYEDMAKNKCTGINYSEGTTNPEKFTIDKTNPIINVSYDNNSVQNQKYFSENRTATVSIIEHNFDPNKVEFLLSESIRNGDISWNSNGDVHTANINYTTDGEYVFDVKMSDMAGNSSGEVNYGSSISPKEFTIDKEIRKPIISGVENGKAYKDIVIPVIEFDDVNYSSNEIKLLRTRRDEINVDVTDTFINNINTTNNGGNGEYNTFEKEIENDGIYTLIVKVMDLAGNEEEETVTFVVNRFGSVYALSEDIIGLKDSYVQGVDKELVIKEYNANRLLSDSLKVEITCDGTLLSDVKYKVNPIINNEVKTGESGWYEYEYIIEKTNFNKDGIYRITVSSEDEAGNKPETINYEDCNVLFRVDTTVAEIININGLENSIINASSEKINFDVFDAIGIKSVTVYLNNEVYKTFDDSNNTINFSGTFEINEGTNQKIRFVIEDMAGNILDTDEESDGFDFVREVTVSTNALIRFYANKKLFYGTIAGLSTSSLAAGIFINFRRKTIIGV